MNSDGVYSVVHIRYRYEYDSSILESQYSPSISFGFRYSTSISRFVSTSYQTLLVLFSYVWIILLSVVSDVAAKLASPSYSLFVLPS